VEEEPTRRAEERGPGARAESRGRHDHVYAALDLGTNNCRLLVARPARDTGGFEVIDAFSRIVRLGERVSKTGYLSEAAIERTVRALRVCAAKIERRGATRVRSVATEACRRAHNGADFIRLAGAETGIDIDIITPDEEGRLALAGCMPLIVAEAAYALVFDIGGGSTEVMWLEQRAGGERAPIDAISLPLGVVTLAERFGGRDVTPAIYRAMVEETRALLAPLEARNGIGRHTAAGRIQMLGTSGTVTTLAAIHLRLPKYDRAQIDGCWIETAAIETTTQMLLGMSFRDRILHPCIRRGRADLVIAGCAILDAILQMWPVPRLRVADRGLREGILLGLMAEADHEAIATADREAIAETDGEAAPAA